jgi:endonuclease/exonuclease/phosphatase family metal-dependent hydrolase
MEEWAEEVRDAKRPLLVFAQETTVAWREIWASNGYNVFLGEPRKWRIQSAMICRDDLECRQVRQDHYPSLAYHGDYLASAIWSQSPVGELLCVSVHASPHPAEPERYQWPWMPHGLTPRDRGNDRRYPVGLWDSDFVLKTLELMAADERPVLAAGDFNESRLHDTDDTGADLGTWGAEYFQRVAAAGYTEPLHRAWGGERPTRGRLQLDHVLTSQTANTVVPVAPPGELDSAWATSPADKLSDHRAVWFPIAAQKN